MTIFPGCQEEIIKIVSESNASETFYYFYVVKGRAVFVPLVAISRYFGCCSADLMMFVLFRLFSHLFGPVDRPIWMIGR
jgi:hypothetical protein